MAAVTEKFNQHFLNKQNREFGAVCERLLMPSLSSSLIVNEHY